MKKEIYITKSDYERKSSRFYYEILRPGGNDTAVVFVSSLQEIQKRETRKKIDAAIKKANPNVEQVGFLDFSDPLCPQAMMTGEESCGNFLRCCGYLLYLKSNRAQASFSLKFWVEGKPVIVDVGVNGWKKAWAQIPIVERQLEKIPYQKYQIIELPGITHVVVPLPTNMYPTEAVAKQLAYSFLTSNGLKNLIQERSALGVMFFATEDNAYRLFPIVWVSEISSQKEDCYYETACATGTAALAIAASQISGQSETLQVLQPSGSKITSSTTVENGVLTKTIVTGPIKRLTAKKNY